VNAEAGVDQAVNKGELVTLNGSENTPAGGIFAWVLNPPIGSSAVLSGGNTATPTFTPDVEGEYVILLTYTVDPNSDTDTVTVVAE
jgi:hypothetical protein